MVVLVTLILVVLIIVVLVVVMSEHVNVSSVGAENEFTANSSSRGHCLKGHGPGALW